MPLTTDSRVTILDIAVRLHCASTVLTKDATAVIDTAVAFAAFAEAESAAPAGNRRKTKQQEVPEVAETQVATIIAETLKETTPKVDTTTPNRQAPPQVAQAAASTVSEADIKAAIGKLATTAAAGGAPKAREILAKLGGGATNISTLKPAHYAEVYAAVMAALKTAEDAAAVAA